MKKNRILAFLFAACMIFALVACGTTQAPAGTDTPSTPSTPSTPDNTATPEANGEKELDVPNQQLSIATASSGGAYYVIGTGMAEVITSHVEPLNVTAEITDGGVANVRLVSDGDSDIGFCNADSIQFGLEGSEPYGSVQDILPICALHSSAWQVVTTEKSGITSIADLKGKKVAVGPAGGGSVTGLTVALAAYGMTMDDIIPTYVSYDDGITQLTDGQVSAALAMSGTPTAAISSMAATDKVVMVSIDDEHMAKIKAAAPYYSAITIPAAMYGMDADAVTIGVKNIVFVSSRLSDDTVYAITKAVVENLDELKTYHSAVAEVTPESMCDVGDYPFAPGAEAYYKDAGLIK